MPTLRAILLLPLVLIRGTTAPEIDVIVGAVKAEGTTAAPPGRRRAARRITHRVLPSAPRVVPRTT